MPTEQQIQELAFSIWEKEGRPDGKDLEHYFRARETLIDQERASVIKLTTPTPAAKLAAPPVTPKLSPPPPKRAGTTGRKKS
jgi:hypothetical protein